jgi:hypothetical protein
MGRDLAMAEMPTSVYLTFQYRLRVVRLEQPFESCSRPSSAAHKITVQRERSLAKPFLSAHIDCSNLFCNRINYTHSTSNSFSNSPFFQRTFPWPRACTPEHSWQAFRLRSTSDPALLPMIDSVSLPTAHRHARVQ